MKIDRDTDKHMDVDMDVNKDVDMDPQPCSESGRGRELGKGPRAGNCRFLFFLDLIYLPLARTRAMSCVCNGAAIHLYIQHRSWVNDSCRNIQTSGLNPS